MTPTNLSIDARVVDQRNRVQRDSTQDEQASSGEPSFDETLSTFQEENTRTGDPVAASTAASMSSPNAITNKSSPAGSALPLAPWSPTMSGTLSSQSKGAGIAIAQLADIAAAKTVDPTTSLTAALGKTAAAKAGSSGPSSDPAAGTTVASTLMATPDFFSLFGISAQRSATTQTPQAAASTVDGVAGTATIKSAQAGTVLPEDPAQETEVVIATDIASFSHLAPAPVVAGAQTSAKASGSGKSDTGNKGDPKRFNQIASSSAALDTQSAVSDVQSDDMASVAVSSKGLAIAAKADTPPMAQADTGSMQAPIEAIADAVTRLASAPAEAPSANAATVAAPANPSETSASLTPARTMTLQLTPADLGTVSVRLHLIGGSLDVSLGVSDQQTLGLLTREQSTLSDALNGQTYQLNSLVIQGTDAAAAPGGQNASQGHSGGNNSSYQQESGGSGARDGSRSARQQSDTRQDAAVRTPSSASNQLFV